MAILRQPLLHFLLLGSLLFWLSTRGTTPLPEPVTETPNASAAVKELSAADKALLADAALARGWHLTDPIARRRLVQVGQFVADGHREPLYAALALDLHRHDLVVRRRLAQRMLQQAWAEVASLSPSEADLRALYEAGDYSEPARMSFEHRFFSHSRRDDALADARAARSALEMADPDFASVAGDPFLNGNILGPLTQAEVVRLFGAQFAASLFESTNTSGLQGPIASTYGQHLVRITGFQPASKRPFDAARKTLESTWRRNAEHRAVAMLIQRLED